MVKTKPKFLWFVMFPNYLDNARLPVLSSKQGWQKVFVSSKRNGGGSQTPECLVSSLIKELDENNWASIFSKNFLHIH